uniref:Alpha-2-macroglobulin-like protein 1 isoform X1 n=2 Tax=Pogona vitticeps TaxID=103695 RepID=A0ABM5FQT1_9SAUR
MGPSTILQTLFALSFTTVVISDPHYLVAFPAIVHSTSTEQFCILLRSLPETVHVSVTLEMFPSQNHTLLDKEVEKPGIYECHRFQVPPFPHGKKKFGQDSEEVAHARILIRKGDSVRFEGRKKVLVENPYRKTLTVLDKPFYKPGETVKFRIVRLNEEFKALDETIPLIELKDSNENRIGQWTDVKPHHGIIDLSFPLASETALGEYTIKIEGMDKAEQNFKVEEYVPVKFEVLLELPHLITTADEEIHVKVQGRYTYGKPVHGKVHLHLTRDVSFYFFEDEQLGREGSIHLNYTGQTDKTGCASFTINATGLHLSQRGYDTYIKLSADLEEEGTGTTGSGRGIISVRTGSVEVNFMHLNSYYKQGFPYKGKMTFTVGGVPIKNHTVYLTVDINHVDTHLSYVTDENGEVNFSLDTTKWKNTEVFLQGRYSLFNVTQGDPFDPDITYNEAFAWVKPFYSESNSFLEIHHVEETLPCGKDQQILVDYVLDRTELDPEANHIDFYYMVVSKGKIVTSGQKEVPTSQDENAALKGTFSLTLSPSSDFAPTAWLLLFAVFADGEVAADMDQFPIEKCIKHKVTLDFSEKEKLPHSEVSLQIEAAPGALCSLHVVDKSVLIKENVTLTPEKLYNDYRFDTLTTARGFMYHVEDFEPYPCLPAEGKTQNQPLIAPWFQKQPDVYSLFKQLRMKLFTNTRVKKPVSCQVPVEGEAFGGGVPHLISLKNEADVVPQSIPKPVTHKKEKAKPRAYFPETWIWNLVPINEEGKATHSVTVPDTITEWNANAFCVASSVGFGLSQQATLTVFKPFFADLQLPYSVVRGETFLVKAIVFNYLKECIQVKIDLPKSQEVEMKPCPTCQFTACLCSDEAETFFWNVTATQLGQVNLSVTVEAMETQDLCGNEISTTPTQGRSDTVIKSVLVKAEGVLEEKTHNAFLCSSGEPVEDDISVELPETAVEDSGRATISAIGDIMGTSLQNIGQLLQMPFGCGEQNMVKFVPNIFVLQYLEATNQATPEIKEKAEEYMKSGYQRQLLYKHDDGSYSAFGKNDAEGNTWLTAFVAKAFGQAKSYTYIEEKHIQDAVQWLGRQQLPSGCFQNVGKLFNNALKGAVDDDFLLTAYITASLLELHFKTDNTMVDGALRCLRNNSKTMNGTYPKALLAYVFSLAGDKEIRQQLLQELEDEADKTDGTLSFLETETTAYFLLAHLSAPDVSTDKPSQIVRSLTKRQNPYGGFYSTQDTIVALQALAKYASLTYRETEELKVLVKSSKDFQHEFHVDKKNRLMLQKVSLPEIPGQYKVTVSGNGCVYVQAVLRYNWPPKMTNMFALNVETLPEECNQTSRKHFDIHLQVSYKGKRETSNMVLIEISMVSGFIPVKKSVKELERETHVKKVEFDPDKISIYLDELDSGVQSYSFSVEQEFEVTDLKPAVVKVYDYYHPDEYEVVEYSAPCTTESTNEMKRKEKS